MARFDVYRHPQVRQRRTIPFLVSIQSDALEFLHSTIVIPLVAEQAFGPRIPFLHPVLDVIGRPVVLATNELVAVERSLLGAAGANAGADASAISAAMDYRVAGC